jgi:sulfur-oxidizing protein SoxX
MKLLLLTVIGVFVMFLAGCDFIARGFSLPAGDVEAGKIVYTEMQCHSCHQLPNIAQLPATDGNTISVKLGGEVSKARTYGQLVTSVINPSHRISRRWEPQNSDAAGNSSMRNYNDVMTVKQLIDVVSFLESQYELRPYDHSRYQNYYP